MPDTEAAVSSTFANVEVRQDVEELQSLRPLVPSEREIESGQVPQYEFRPYVEQVAGIHLGTALRGAFRQMDIRDITAHGPILPLILLGYLQCVYQIDYYAIGVFLPEIRQSFAGTGVGFLQSMLGLIGIGALALAPFMGFLSDRFRRTTMLAVGSVVGHSSIVLAGFSSGLPQFMGARTLGAASELVRSPVGFPLLADWYPPQTRARVFAFIFMTGAVGTVVGPSLAGIVGSQFGWHQTFLIFGGVSAIVSLSFFLLKEPVRGRQDRLAMGADEQTAMREQRPLKWTEGWRAAWSIRTLRYIAYAQPFSTAVTASLATLTPLFYAEKFGLTPISRGLVASIVAVPVVFGLGLTGPIADRLIAYKPGRVLSMLAGIGVLNAVGLLLFIYTPFLPLAVLFNMVPLVLATLLQPAMTTVASLVIPARVRGMGLQTLAPWTAGGAVIAVILGVVLGTNGIEVALTLLVPVALINALIIGLASRGVEPDIRAGLAASLADEAARKAKLEGRSKLLVCRDVDVTYDGAQVLYGVDFDVEEGETVALLGTNGAGKSTLLRAILGIQQASNGAIFLDGDDITHLPSHQVAARGVVMMPGGQAIFATLTVEQNLQTAAWLNRNDIAYVKQRVQEVLEYFPRLKERWKVKAGDLSGGEQQMVALGQALLMKPRLLMIDELSLGLAPSVVEMLLETLREINRQGTTIVIVEQSINVALQIATRAVFLDKGQVRFDGPVADLMRRPDVVRSVFLTGAATAPSLGQSSERRLLVLRQEESDQILDVNGVSLTYGGLQVLSQVSLVAFRREVVGLIGPNGAGKTSLFDAITGFAIPSAGEIRFLDRDVTRLGPDYRARLGIARSYQSVRLFPALTVRENIAVAIERHLGSRSAVLAAIWSPMTRGSERRVRRRVDNLIESLNLGAFADKFVNELSTGSRRIVDIACLLAAQPSLLLLDEPSSGLAQAETEQLGPVIGRVVKETGCGVLLIEHDLGLAASVCHRLVALRLGEVMAEGTPAEVLANQEVIDSLLGGASAAVVSRSIKATAVAGREK